MSTEAVTPDLDAIRERLDVAVRYGFQSSPITHEAAQAWLASVGDASILLALVDRQAAELARYQNARVTVEWAAEVRYLSGEVRYDAATGVLAASVTAHGINDHVASLNEATREFNGIEGAQVVSREVRDLVDGSRLIGPWKPVEGGESE